MQIEFCANSKVAQAPSTTYRWSPVSLRLGHACVLTPHRGVIHSAHAASLPLGGRRPKAAYNVLGHTFSFKKHHTHMLRNKNSTQEFR